MSGILTKTELAVCQQLGMAPEVFHGAKVGKPGHVAACSARLSGTEREVCERLGIAPEAFLRSKENKG